MAGSRVPFLLSPQPQRGDELRRCLLFLAVSALATATTSSAPTPLPPSPTLQCPIASKGSGGCCIFVDGRQVFASTVGAKLKSPLKDNCTLTHPLRLERNETREVVVNIQPSDDLVFGGKMKFANTTCRMPPGFLLTRTLTPSDGASPTYNLTFVISAKEDAGSTVCVGFVRQGMLTGEPFFCFPVAPAEPATSPTPTTAAPGSSTQTPTPTTSTTSQAASPTRPPLSSTPPFILPPSSTSDPASRASSTSPSLGTARTDSVTDDDTPDTRTAGPSQADVIATVTISVIVFICLCVAATTLRKRRHSSIVNFQPGVPVRVST